MNIRSTLTGFLITTLLAAASAGGKEPPPNFILILADDMGWNDAGFCGNPFTDTPHLDQLAKEGMIFTQACASAPNCAATRACLMTGQYPPRHGVFTVVDDRHTPGSPHHKIMAAKSREALPKESVTLAEALRQAGYATGMFGMWNLGRGRNGSTTPNGQGFDVFIEPKQLGFEKDEYRNSSGAYSPDALTDAALKWMDGVKDRPFFLYLPFHDVHAPFDPKPELLAKYKTRRGVIDPALAATVEAMDANVGRVWATVKNAGLEGRTYLVFTSDNGGARQYVAPLRGGKGTLHQGGVRVPALMRGPGIKPGTSTAVPILSMDWFPTSLDLANVPAPKDQVMDGVSLVPFLTGKQTTLTRDLFWHISPATSARAVPAARSGRAIGNSSSSLNQKPPNSIISRMIPGKRAILFPSTPARLKNSPANSTLGKKPQAPLALPNPIPPTVPRPPPNPGAAKAADRDGNGTHPETSNHSTHENLPQLPLHGALPAAAHGPSRFRPRGRAALADVGRVSSHRSPGPDGKRGSPEPPARHGGGRGIRGHSSPQRTRPGGHVCTILSGGEVAVG